jgi:uncharacterized protein
MCRAVIVLGGSQGGVPEHLAYQFSERGFAALALAYFGAADLPPQLANIPLEYVDLAVAWLQRQPHTDTRALAVVGVSRGAELALLVASHNPAIKRVVAYAPSHVAWGPVGDFADKSIPTVSRHAGFSPRAPSEAARRSGGDTR